VRDWKNLPSDSPRRSMICSSGQLIYFERNTVRTQRVMGIKAAAVYALAYRLAKVSDGDACPESQPPG
jgi:hypothetical protein